jgi:hypothetical protein
MGDLVRLRSARLADGDFPFDMDRIEFELRFFPGQIGKGTHTWSKRVANCQHPVHPIVYHLLKLIIMGQAGSYPVKMSTRDLLTLLEMTIAAVRNPWPYLANHLPSSIKVQTRLPRRLGESGLLMVGIARVRGVGGEGDTNEEWFRASPAWSEQ